MKKVVYLCILMVVASASIAQKKSNLKLNTKNVGLALKMDTAFCVGCEIVANIQLSAKKNSEVFDLETAGLVFTTCKLIRGKYEVDSSGPNISIGGPTGFYKDTGGDGVQEWGEYDLKQNLIKLKPGERLSKKYELYSLTDDYLLLPGKYELSVEYEFQLRDKSYFIILFNYSEDIPRLISYLEQKRSFGHGEQTPLDLIYTLTGYPNWKNLLKDQHYNDLPNVSKWWESSKDIIMAVESTLKKPSYSKFDYKKELPQLVQKLKSGNQDERRRVKRILSEVIGSPSFLDLDNNTDETIQKEIEATNNWWSSNRPIVEYVNFIMINTEY